MLLFVTGCGLDTDVKSFQGSVNPVEEECAHAEADKSHPICEQFKSACVFYACKVDTDPNYSKYLEYKNYIENLKGVGKGHSTIFHDSTKCANTSSKINAIVFSKEPSSAGHQGVSLPNQPEVSIIKENGDVAKISSPVTLSVHKTSDCSDTAVPYSTDWTMSSANPVNTVDGKHQYSNLKFLKLGTYYLKAATSNLKPACSVSITITEDPGIGKSLVFLDPKPSLEALHSRNLTKQPKIGIVNYNGDLVDVDNIDITLSLHSDDKCLSAQVTDWEATENPVKSVDGIATFTGVAIKKGGSFYFRSYATGLAASCFGPIKVADRLKFTQLPSSVSIKDQPLATQPIIGVSHQDGSVAPFDNVSVKLAVYTDTACSVVAPSSDYAVTSNPVESNTSGLSSFAGLTFKKEQKFYVRGESLPLLPTDCVPVDVGTNAKKVIFLDPLPSSFNLKNKDFEKQPKVAIVDGSGNIIPDNGKSVLLSLHSDNACTSTAIANALNAKTNPGSTTSGVFQFENVNVSQGGTYYLRVSSAGLDSTCVGPIKVAEKLKLEQPASGKVGEALQPNPKVSVVLPNNEVIPYANVPITYKIFKDSACTQVAPSSDWEMTSVNPVLSSPAGVATFENVVLKNVGTFYSKATTTESLSPTDCLKLEGNALASKLAFAQPDFPTAWVKKKLLSPQPSVEVLDANNNIVPVSIPVELSLHESSDCLSAALAKGPSNFWDVDSTPNTTTNGKITFAGTKIYKAGKYYFKATTSSPGIQSACSFAIEIADKLIFDPAPPTTVVQNKPLSVDPSVKTVRGASSLVPVNGESITLEVYTGANCSGAQIPSSDWSLSSSNPGVTSSGSITFSGIIFKKVNQYYIKATHAELDPVCSGVIAVTPGANSVVFTEPKPSTSGGTNNPLEKQPKVQILDSNGNPVANDDREVKLSVASDSQCSQEISSNDYEVAAPNPAMTSQGVKQFSGVKIKKGGVYYLKISSTGLTGSCFGPIEIADALSFVKQPATPHLDFSPIDLNPIVGVVRPTNVLVKLNKVPITLEMYRDSLCQGPKLVLNQDWKLVEALPKDTVDGKAEFTKFGIDNSQGYGDYYLKATSPGFASACSEKFEIKPAGTSGCTEPLAKNYNPLATKDDCSCVFEFCPVDKPSKDSAQARYYSYAYDKQCKSIPDYVDTCGGSCEDKKDEAQANENKSSGYVYKCDKFKNIYEDNCLSLPTSDMYCSMLKSMYQACYRTETCSKYGLVNDVQALLDLAKVQAIVGYSGISLFNAEDNKIFYQSSFDSVCLKLQYKPAYDSIALTHPEIKDLFDKYCDCTECEDPGICNHPDAENYNPGPGAGSGTGTGTAASICSNLGQLAQACAASPNSFACYQYKTMAHYCGSINSCLSTVVGAGVSVPACFLNPQAQQCASVCDAIQAPFWYCSQPANQNTPYCADFFKYYSSCQTTGNPPPNYQGVFPSVGCQTLNYTACPVKCYQGTTGVGNCDEAKKFIDLYCDPNTVTDVVTAQKCTYYKEYYKYCLNTKFCNLDQANWPYKDLLSLINALPTFANDANTCIVYNSLWTMCTKPNAIQSALEYSTCQKFFGYVKSCASGQSETFYNLDCSNYQYYLKNCANKCPDDDGSAESCKFRVCSNPKFADTLGYHKYLEYIEYCKKKNVTCQFTSDDSLCVGTPSKGSLRPIKPVYDPTTTQTVFAPYSQSATLSLWLDDIKNRIISFSLEGENFLVEASNGPNETGVQLKPWNESSHLYFYTDSNCSVPMTDLNCKIAHNPASNPTYTDRVKYSGEQSLGPWPCQVKQPNGSVEIMKSFKIKSATKESLCRPVAVMMN